MLSDMKERFLVDGVVVIECERVLSFEEMQRIQAAAETMWGDRKVLVLTKGLRIAGSPDRLDLVEAKLDRLLEQTKPKPKQWFGGPL